MIKSVKRNLLILKFNRTWVDNDSHKFLTYFLRIFNVTVQFLMMFVAFKKIISVKDDLTSVSYCIIVLGLNGPCFGKLAGLIRYANSYKEILRRLESGLSLRYKIKKNELRHIEEAEKFIANNLNWYIWIALFTVSIWLSVPLLKKLIGSYPDDNLLDLPFIKWSPFHENDYFKYTLLYILQTYYAFSMWTIWVGELTLCTGIVYHISGHLNIIGERIENFQSAEKLKPNEISMMTKEMRDLRNIILYHVEILELGKKFNEACSQGFFHGLFFVSLILCCCGIQVITLSGKEAIFFVMGIFTMSLMLTWLIACFLGTKIISESQKLGETIYFSDWTSLTKIEKKDVCFILHRTQFPIHMTAGKFYTISLSLFLDMTKMAYSLLAVLRNMFD